MRSHKNTKLAGGISKQFQRTTASRGEYSVPTRIVYTNSRNILYIHTIHRRVSENLGGKT